MNRRKFFAALGATALIPTISKSGPTEVQPTRMIGADIPRCAADSGKIVGIVWIAACAFDVKTGRSRVTGVTQDGTTVQMESPDGVTWLKAAREQ